MRRETKRVGVFTRRALLLMGAEVTALGLLAGRLYQVQVVNGDRYLTMAEENRISARLVAPPRGRILDRFGTAVAGNKLNWRALLIAEQTEDVGLTLDNLARIVALSDNERVRIEREVHRHRRFIPTMVREFLTWDEMARIEVHAPDLPGILIDVGTTRVYPFSDKLAHIVGYVAPPSEADTTGDDPDPMLSLPGMRVGRAGIEKFHDEALRGRAGVVQLEVNAVGRVIRELDRQEGVPGTEIGLTVDSELQKQVLDRLGDESASAVVMDCRNGEVLAMATNPSFDPSLFDSGVSQAQWIEWTQNRRTPLINKAAAGLYAPGSTFKMAVALAALDAKTLSPTDRIHCPGFLDLGGTQFHCWRKGGHGSLDLHGGLKHSCDVFFYETARRTGIDHISAMSHRLGMGVNLAIDLPGARPGLDTDAAMAHLQGPPLVHGRYDRQRHRSGLHPGDAAATRDLCVSGRHGTGGDAASDPPQGSARCNRGRSRRTGRASACPSAACMPCVRACGPVVNEGGGTAPVARIPGQFGQLAGKTGSSQVRRVSRALRESGRFRSEKLPWEFRPHALFVAYAPYDAPRYAVSVVVEHGNAGAAAAAPVARDIMISVMTRDPVNRQEAPGQKVAAR